MATRRRAFGKVCGVSMVVGALGAVGCGQATGAGSGHGEPAPDGLAEVSCAPWRPSAADWSSVSTSRPAMLGELSASPSGDYLYTVGTWLDAGRVKRQVLRSHDSGATWCVLGSSEEIVAVTPSPANEAVLYALTCTISGGQGALLKTTDGGGTWVRAAAELPDGCNSRDPGATLLQASFTNPDLISLRHYDTSDRSESNGKLYVSRNGGDAWTVVPPPPAFEPFLQPIAGTQDDWILAALTRRVIDPNDAARVLAAGRINRLSSPGGPMRWFSTDDSGSNWRELTAPPLPAGSDPDRLFADSASTLYMSAGSTLWRSKDWGQTWSAPVALPPSATHLAALGARNAGRLYTWLRGGAVWTSHDAGSSWSALGAPLDVGTEPVLAPKETDLLIGRGASRISVTARNGKAWNHGAFVPRPGTLTQSPLDRRRLWASGGLVPINSESETYLELESADGGSSWTRTDRPDGPFLMDGASADAALATLGGFQSPHGSRTEDGGQTWSEFLRPAGGVVASAACAPPFSCIILVLTESEPGRPCRLARSDDRGRSWRDDTLLPSELCFRDKLAISPDGPEHLVLACEGGVCETRDAGKSWQRRSFGPVEGYMTSLSFLANGVALAAVTKTSFDLPEQSVVARSVDGGTTWSEVLSEGGTLTASMAHPATAFLISRASNGADTIRRSDDAGVTWKLVFPTEPETASDPNLFVTSVADTVAGGFVATTTYGLVGFE